MKIYFVAGTGTDVGKTYVTASLIRGWRRSGRRVGAYKPVASGCRRIADETLLQSEDADALYEALGGEFNHQLICPQRFVAAVAPDEAARREGRVVDEVQLNEGVDAWQPHCDTLLIEGAGGLFSPIADSMLNFDLLKALPTAELLLVAPNRLGVIHDVIATVRAAQAEERLVQRLYLSSADVNDDESSSSNAKQIETWCAGLEIETIAYGAEAEVLR
ncbi:MAG: dethiobiotin synthase [Planctomycetota bacterium]